MGNEFAKQFQGQGKGPDMGDFSKFNPEAFFKGFGNVQHVNMNDLQGLFRDFAQRTQTSSGAMWSPQADVVETSQAFLVVLDVPGLTRSDIKLKLKGDTLVVSGRREAAVEEESKVRVMSSERAVGEFERSIPFPAEESDTARISATCKEGVLTITIPKKNPTEKTDTTEIPIQ